MPDYTTMETGGGNNTQSEEKSPKLNAQNSNSKQEILWNVVNSLLSGGLVFAGGFIGAGNINFNVTLASLVAAGIAAISQFKKYWEKEEGEYCNKTLFSFVGGGC